MPARSDVVHDDPDPHPAVLGRPVVKGIALADYRVPRRARARSSGQWGLKPAAATGGRTSDLARVRGSSALRTGWTASRPRACIEPSRWSTATSRAGARATTSWCCRTTGSPSACRFTFPGSARDRHLCLADFFRPRESGEIDVVGLPDRHRRRAASRWPPRSSSPRTPTATTSSCTASRCSSPRRWRSTGTPRVRAELGIAGEDSPDLQRALALGYRGARFSLGYGACPDLEDRAKIVELLAPERIGVDLSEEFQLHPEQSTDAHRRPPPRGQVLQRDEPAGPRPRRLRRCCGHGRHPRRHRALLDGGRARPRRRVRWDRGPMPMVPRSSATR